MMDHTSAKQRRSLKGALRTILWKCRRQSPDEASSIIGSGILRREPSLPTLPNESTTAFLLGLDSDEYDERYDHDIPDRFDISSLATSAAMSSTRTLMPKMSLNDFNAYHPPIQEMRYLRRGRYSSISSSLAEGASYQASLVSISSYPSASTLRIQKSAQTLISESEQHDPPMCFPERIDTENEPYSRPTSAFECPSPPQVSRDFSPRRSLVRKKSSIGDLVSVDAPAPPKSFEPPAFIVEDVANRFQPYNPYNPYGGRRFHQALSVIEEDVNSVDERRTLRSQASAQFLDIPQISRTPSLNSDNSNPLLSIKPFSSFCALDTVTPGCPVTATSKDLRYIFEIGEQFCLNNQGFEDISIDMITGSDAAGNPVTHLVLFNPLIIPSSGRSRFMLASLIDVTDFIHDAASLPELEMTSEESVESDPPTPRCKTQPNLRGPKYQLSAESLLGGCFIEEPRTPTMQRIDEDIWLNLATEERKHYSQPKIHSNTKSPGSAASAISSIDEVLDDFVSRLQELHADFFLLAKSPLDDNYYEICNVSPRVYASRDYVNGHLSHTSASDMMELSAQLTGDEAFNMRVRWGTQGVLKHLYCIPLFARSAVTWICFLVDPGLPVLW